MPVNYFPSCCRAKCKTMKFCSNQSNSLNGSASPLSRKYVLVIQMAAWNALFVISGLLLIALMGETYFRLTYQPVEKSSLHFQFVEGVGVIRKPNTENRYKRWFDDYTVISRTNSQGFLDREPVSLERAAAGCHIAVFGDSFVEAMEVPIADKFQVRLEDMASRELPHLAVTTQAYGINGTGQINQIPFYDEYARRLNPKLVVLVFYLNDFVNNSTALESLARGLDPDRMRFMSAQRGVSGAMKLLPPDPDFRRFLLPAPPIPWHEKAWERLAQVSYFARWLNTKVGAPDDIADRRAAWANIIAARPCCASMMDGWRPGEWQHSLNNPFLEEHLPPVFEEALEYTAFGIDQFKRRADRDGATLIILAASERIGTQGDPQFDRLSAIAKAHSIPLISQYDYVSKQGHDYMNGRFTNDHHWNPTGHQWAAEAVLEWLKENQEACD